MTLQLLYMRKILFYFLSVWKEGVGRGGGVLGGGEGSRQIYLVQRIYVSIFL